MAQMAMRVTEMGASEGCPVIGQTEVASPQGDNITSLETELTSRWCSSSRTLEEPMHEAKANDDGVSHWCSITHVRGFFPRGANRKKVRTEEVFFFLNR